MRLGDRLKAERKRLEQTQEQTAGVGGVTVQTQRKYESSVRSPSSDYLERLSSQGFDIQYIVTAHRSVNMEVVYSEPTDALVNILPLQHEFGTFNAEQIKALIGYAWSNQADQDDLRKFVKMALVVAGDRAGKPE